MNAIHKLMTISLLLVPLGCATEGPHYATVSTHARDDRDEIILARYWQRSAPLTFGMELEERFEYFAATLHGGRLGAARRLAQSEWGESARFFPIDGIDRFVFARVGKTIRLWNVGSDDAKPRKLDEATSRLAVETAWAVTRDGRHVLVVDDRGLRVISSITADTVERDARDTLTELRRVIVDHFGSAGTWFVSNDLRHVVVEPPDSVVEASLAMTPEPVKLTVAGVEFTAGREGLIYDRQTRSLSTFPIDLHLPDPAIRYRIVLKAADAHEGKVMLVNVGAKEAGERIVVVASRDLKWQRVGDVPFATRDLEALVAVEFLPERKEVRLLECADPDGLGETGHAPDSYLRTWNYETNRTSVTAIDGKQIVSVIDQAVSR